MVAYSCSCVGSVEVLVTVTAERCMNTVLETQFLCVVWFWSSLTIQ